MAASPTTPADYRQGRRSRRPIGRSEAQRVRDGVAHMSQKFVRYGLTSVHHDEGGDLMALQQQRARGDLQHRVSYEPDGTVLEAMIKNGIETGFGDE